MDIAEATHFFHQRLAAYMPASGSEKIVPAHTDDPVSCDVCGTRVNDYFHDERQNRALFANRCQGCNSLFISWPEAYGKKGNFTQLSTKVLDAWTVMVTEDGMRLYSAEPKKAFEIPPGSTEGVTWLTFESNNVGRVHALLDAMERLVSGAGPLLIFQSEGKIDDLLQKLRLTHTLNDLWFGDYTVGALNLNAQRWLPLLSQIIALDGRGDGTAYKQALDTIKRAAGTDADGWTRLKLDLVRNKELAFLARPIAMERQRRGLRLLTYLIEAAAMDVDLRKRLIALANLAEPAAAA